MLTKDIKEEKSEIVTYMVITFEQRMKMRGWNKVIFLN